LLRLRPTLFALALSTPAAPALAQAVPGDMGGMTQWAAWLILLVAAAIAVLLLRGLFRAKREARDWAEFSENNPHPVLRISLQGQVLHANAAARPLLDAWGNPLPPEILAALAQAAEKDRPEEVVCSAGQSRLTVRVVPAKGRGHLHLYCRDTTREEDSRRHLAASEASYRALFEAYQDALFIHDMQTGDILDVNPRMLRMFGYSKEEAANLDVGQLSSGEPPYDQEHARELVQKAAAGQPQAFDWYCKTKDGRLFWAEVHLTKVEVGGHERILANVRDITWRKESEQQLRLAASFFENTIEGIMVTDAKGNIQMVNPAFSTITGYSAAEAVGQRPNLLRSRRHGDDFYRQLWKRLKNQGFWEGEVWNRRKNGEAYPQRMSITAIPDDRGRTVRYLAVFHDISDAWRRQENMRHLAHHDHLTGLPNRLLLMDRLKMAIARGRRDGRQVAIIYSDLDGFKRVNDTLGHAAGDTLLVQAAGRLSKTLRGEDTVSRPGGAEFVMILPAISHPSYAKIAARRVINQFSAPFDLEGSQVSVTTSLGISLFPGDASDPEGLLRAADRAMYRAKASGGNTFCFWKDIQPQSPGGKQASGAGLV
jgi:diguanylate cyclase (GGDEF)-like protein/PAS domain S-box-containing protein